MAICSGQRLAEVASTEPTETVSAACAVGANASAAASPARLKARSVTHRAQRHQSVICVTPGRIALSTSSAPGKSPRLSIAFAKLLSFERDTFPVGSKK